MGNDPLLQAVSDAGPLIHLAQVSKLHLLRKIFKRVLITPQVKKKAVDEGISLGYSDAAGLRKSVEEGWIEIEALSEVMVSAAERLSEGENLSLADAEILLLAKEKRATIIVDEKILSDLAKMYGLQVWNTWTVLLDALRRRFIEVSDVESAILELGEKRHKLKTKQATEIMEAAKIIDSRRQKGSSLLR